MATCPDSFFKSTCSRVLCALLGVSLVSIHCACVCRMPMGRVTGKSLGGRHSQGEEGLDSGGRVNYSVLSGILSLSVLGHWGLSQAGNWQERHVLGD